MKQNCIIAVEVALSLTFLLYTVHLRLWNCSNTIWSHENTHMPDSKTMVSEELLITRYDEKVCKTKQDIYFFCRNIVCYYTKKE